MRQEISLPEIAVVRVLTPGGPYVRDETLSVAFTAPTAARLATHRATGSARRDVAAPAALVPDTISVVVVRAAAPFVEGETLTLSFVDATVARIHASAPQRIAGDESASHAEGASAAAVASTASIATALVAATATARASDERADVVLAAETPSAIAEFRTAPFRAPAELSVVEESRAHAGAALGAETPRSAEDAAPDAGGVRVRLEWTAERARRFVQVVDKLFTVDRLGWYRHALAMRLLIPDVVECAEASARNAAMQHLGNLRAAALEALGKPLLNAFMPGFSVTPAWLAELDSPAVARALAGLRDAVRPHLQDGVRLRPAELDPAASIGIVERCEFDRMPGTSVETLLPVLVPAQSPLPLFEEALLQYRLALMGAFAQTAEAAEAVRLNAMAHPNRSLDDRLWRLVGSVSDTFAQPALVSGALR